MRTFNKLLTAIFVILLLVTIGEIGYYFFGDTIITQNQSNITKTTLSKEDQFVHPEQIQYLSTLKKDPNNHWSHNYMSEIEGTVNQLTWENDNRCTFNLVDKNGKLLEKMRIDTNKKTPLFIYQYQGNNRVLIKTTELKNALKSNVKIKNSRYFDMTKALGQDVIRTELSIF